MAGCSCGSIDAHDELSISRFVVRDDAETELAGTELWPGGGYRDSLLRQTLESSFSDVSKPNFASKCSLELGLFEKRLREKGHS